MQSRNAAVQMARTNGSGTLGRRSHGGRGKEASARYEKSIADAKVRHKAEASVSNPLAIDGEEGPEGTVTN